MAALASLEKEEEIKGTGADSTAASTLEKEEGGACIDTSATPMTAVVRLPGFDVVNDGAANIPSTNVVVACGTGDTGDTGDGGGDGGGGGSGGVVLHFVVVVVVVVEEEEEEDNEDEECSCAFS